jgi:hypothetical protein
MNFKPLVRTLVASSVALVGQFAAGGSVALAQPSDSPTTQESPADASKSDARPTEPKRTPQADGKDARHAVEEGIPGLQEMLAVALQHNPDIRAADAQVRLAEAERDRTRLAVVQKIVAYRERWQTQRAAEALAEDELSNAEYRRRLAETGAIPPSEVGFEAAQGKLTLARDRLGELRAELPFLLGQLPQAGADTAPMNFPRRTQLLKDTLRTVLQDLLKARIAEYQAGRASLEQIFDASRRLMEVERSLATTEDERVAAIERHRDMMKQLREWTRQGREGGLISQADALMTEAYVAEAELLLVDEQAGD